MVSAPALSLDDVAVRAGGKTLFSCDHLEFWPGLAAVVGPNGAGKTTLLKIAAGLAGEKGVTLGGAPLETLSLRDRARHLAYLPQQPQFHWPLTVRAIVGLGRFAHGDGPEDRAAIERAMTTAGIAALADRPVSTLSGGERARVAMARALAGETPVLLVDEPAAALDPQYQIAVMALLRERASAGVAVVLVTHDLNAALRNADRCVVVSRGSTVADGAPVEVLDEALLGRVFGVRPSFAEVDGKAAIAAFGPLPQP